MSVTIKQIPPEPGTNLMGLEQYGFSVFPGCSTSFEIPWINGRPNIGLEEKKDKDKREKFENFWGVKFDSEEGRKFLSEYEIKLNHDINAFDPDNNIRDAWNLHLLQVNQGIGIVAVNDDVINEVAVNNFRFKISDDNRDLEQEVSKKTTLAKASSELLKLFESSSNRVVLLAKYIFPAGSGISTKNQAYSRLDQYIKGVKDAEKFLNALKLEPEYIDIVVKVKEAIFRGIIRVNNDGRYMIQMSGTILGRTEEEVVNYCLNPANADIVGTGGKTDSPSSLTSLLGN